MQYNIIIIIIPPFRHGLELHGFRLISQFAPWREKERDGGREGEGGREGDIHPIMPSLNLQRS